MVIQRVSRASVTIDGSVHGSIKKGFLLLSGFTQSDTLEDVRKVAEKLSGLRIFEDEAGKMNLSLQDVGGEILSISQFTLYANCRKGRRPGFEEAAKPDISKPLYEAFNTMLRELGHHVEEGIFGADMKVELLNDGPVTIILESDRL